MDKKKRLGMKTKIRAEKERERRIATAILLVSILLIVIFLACFTYTFLTPAQNQTNNPSFEPKAAIVDHLSLTFPNQTFIQAATNILEQAGYTVDYYPGEEVTVEFYRNLPTHGYRLIVLRVHSTLTYGQLFTSETYSTSKYVFEQLNDQIIKVSFYSDTPPYYFGISPYFIEKGMSGNFDNATIIMMGCNGLKNPLMASEFFKRGAKACIGWSESVSASHTDQTTIHLLQHLITEKQTIEQVVDKTMEEVGPDPAYNSTIEYYPFESGNYQIQR